ncbi:MAG: gliding motility-associated C-terminal domain-containing protein [Bacteroidota bacterium]
MKGICVFGTYLLLQFSFILGYSQTVSYGEPSRQPLANATACTISVPNVITPNGDGINDALEFECNCTLSDFRFTLYSRKGNRVFQSKNPNLRWKGTYNGKPIKEGYYKWEISYKVSGNSGHNSLKGDLAIIRS